MIVYKKEEIFEFWYYKNNRCVMLILCVVDEGWFVVWVSNDFWLVGVKYILLVFFIYVRSLGFQDVFEKKVYKVNKDVNIICIICLFYYYQFKVVWDIYML